MCPSSPAPHPVPTDDDNDMELAALVRRAYLPGITAPSVERAVERDPGHFFVSATRGVFGAEDALKAVLADAVAGLGQA